jgi:hypothetical protein
MQIEDALETQPRIAFVQRRVLKKDELKTPRATS